jgi:small-conductance mechanosensitive channel
LASFALVPKALHELRRTLGEIPWPNWLWSIAVASIGLAVGRITAAVLTRALQRWAARTKSPIDDVVVRHLRRPMNWLLPVVGLNIALPLTSLPAQLERSLQHGLVICGIVGLGWTLLATVRVIEEVIERRFDLTAQDDLRTRGMQTQFRGFRNIASFMIVLVTIAFVLLTFERVREVGAGLLASAGVAGIVIGFAAQRTLGTLFAGVQIALSQAILVGDGVTVENEFGTVEEITLTYIVIRLWDQRRLIVPVSYVTLRALVSAKNSSDAFDLRCEVRERLIAFVQQTYPAALPRVREQRLDS